MNGQPIWQFREMAPGEMNEDPVQGEFFTQQDLPARLVRETLQNSLDEPAVVGHPVRVRFAFRSTENALLAGTAQKYLAGLGTHLDHTDGVPESIRALVRDSAPLDYFVIEDFGTKGLIGDPAQTDDWEGQPAEGNSFYWFFRNVGRSGKGESEGGSWGLGKWVFPDASRIHSFIAFSVRGDDAGTVVMGQSVLRKHTIDLGDGNHAKYAPYGFFCCLDEDGVQMPVTTGPTVDEFRHEFRLNRTNEPGLSIVIPFPHEELRYEDLLRAVVHYYFYPIVTGDLIVEVEKDAQVLTIDLDSIGDVVDRIDWSSSGVTSDDMKQLFQMALWLRTLPDADLVELSDPPRLSLDGRIDEDRLEELRRRFEDGERLAFRISLPVQKTGEARQRSYFDVCIERDETLKEGQDYFVRHMLSIPDMDFIRGKPVRAFLLAEDPPLHALLRDSEDPSHSSWRPNAQRVRDRYEHGRTTVIFVRKAIERLISVLSKPVEHIDPDALIDTFFVEVVELEDGTEPTSGSEDEGGVTGGPGGGERHPQPFVVEQISGGFVIRSVPTLEAPPLIDVQLAYTVRRGNPLSNYSPFDFDIQRPPVTCQTNGASVVNVGSNRMQISPNADAFRVEVSGFDARRDLYVRARVGEVVE